MQWESSLPGGWEINVAISPHSNATTWHGSAVSTIPDHASVPKNDFALSQSAKCRIVRRHDNRLAPFMKRLKDFKDLCFVEIGGRLVGQDDFGFVDQGAGNTYPLLLASRQLRRQMVSTVGHLHRGQRMHGRWPSAGGWTFGAWAVYCHIFSAGQSRDIPKVSRMALAAVSRVF